jgi:lytic murein transglycosylase
MRAKYASVFERARADYGVPPEVILAFWAMETDYGAVMGEFHTISALATLAHDCRRPELFRPQLIAAMELIGKGDQSINETGAWAGEIGHVQMLPSDILERGVDGDGDGRVTIKTSAPDAILSAAKMLDHHGWRSGEPWLVEVTAPDDLDWSLSGFGGDHAVLDWAQLGVVPRFGDLTGDLQAALILPQGRKGPKFLAFHNFQNVYLEWNKASRTQPSAATR